MYRPLLAFAALGGVLFLVTLFGDPFNLLLVEKFLLFAAFVIVPLITALIGFDNHTPVQRKLARILSMLCMPAAITLLASLLASRSWGLADTAVPGHLAWGWLLFTLLLAVYGGFTIIENGRRAAEVAYGAGLIYCLVGGIWFLLYQYQIPVFQAAPSAHALSALHFHFSSAIVPLFIGALGRVMSKKSWYPWVVAIDIIGPILIAFGMIFSKPVEYIGVGLFACNILIYTTYLLRFIGQQAVSRRTRVILSTSCLAFYAILVISMAYPLLKSRFSLTIFDFIPIYGFLHALGFVLFGLIGWIFFVKDQRSAARI